MYGFLISTSWNIRSLKNRRETTSPHSSNIPGHPGQVLTNNKNIRPFRPTTVWCDSPSYEICPYLQKSLRWPKKTPFRNQIKGNWKKTYEWRMGMEWYCWWFRNPAKPPWDVGKPVPLEDSLGEIPVTVTKAPLNVRLQTLPRQISCELP